MDKELKNKWIEALRSGEYKQGQGRLVQSDDNYAKNYCCLGVLCDVMGMEDNGNVFQDKYSRIYETGMYDLTEPLGLTKKVVVKGKPTVLQDKLIQANDDLGWNFEKIANYLERINF